MNKIYPEKDRIFPFVWPWKLAGNERGSFIALVGSRKFSILYLIIIWSVIAILGFASTRNCEGSWQLALQCDFAFWVKNLVEQPLIFFRNLFTTLFLHNGLDHILFVTILGFVLIVQSHEAVFGSRITGLMFLSSYLTVAPFFGVFYNVGIELFPDSHFMQVAFERNWMGGSIGMFQVYGSLASQSRKPWIMLSVPVIFEAFNLLVLNIDLHISLMHLMSNFLGYGLAVWFIRR